MAKASTIGLFALATLSAWTSACDICYGTTRSETTFRAVLNPSAEGEALASEVAVQEGNSGTDGPGGAWWETAIADASRSEPGFGYVVLKGPGRSFGLVLPLPLSSGQTLPMIAAASAQSVQPFFFELVTDRSIYPRDAVAAWLETPSPSCSPERPADCRVEREQSFAGTVEVRSTRPLGLRLEGTVSYPAESGKAPESVTGDLSFDFERGEICLD
jgi:hypothetical protein